MVRFERVFIGLYALVIGSILLSAVAVEGQTSNCAWDANMIAPSLNSSSGWTCRPIWNSFNLGYSLVQSNILSIVLSAPYTSGWVGMGFSKNGMMVGSSAMVGWINSTTVANIRQFYLSGQSSEQVIAGQGELQFTSVEPSVVFLGSNIYLVFQLNFSSPVARKNLLFAVGSDTPVQDKLTQHSDKVSIALDFSAGTLSASSYPYQLKRSHGILAILGWGVLLPIGAIVARYCRQWDPTWYYLHATIQSIGFSIGLATVIAGVLLYGKLKANIPAHRGIGIFVFALAALQEVQRLEYLASGHPQPLQWLDILVIGGLLSLLIASFFAYISLCAVVTAFALFPVLVWTSFISLRIPTIAGSSQVLVTALFLRPHKEVKIRKYWNWYHHWVGRILLVLAAVNIILGIQAGKPGKIWKIGYAFNVVVLLDTVIILEIFQWIRRFKKPANAPTIQMRPV